MRRWIQWRKRGRNRLHLVRSLNEGLGSPFRRGEGSHAQTQKLLDGRVVWVTTTVHVYDLQFVAQKCLVGRGARNGSPCGTAPLYNVPLENFVPPRQSLKGILRKSKARTVTEP